MDDDCDAEKPEHCLRGHVEHWYDEWEDDEGGKYFDDECYYDCEEWEPGYPKIMTERTYIFPRTDYTRDVPSR